MPIQIELLISSSEQEEQIQLIMKLYYQRSTIEQMDPIELRKTHKTFVIVIISILLISGLVSLLSIWDYIGSIWRYTMLVFIALLWPWIMQSSQMAKQLRKDRNDF